MMKNRFCFATILLSALLISSCKKNGPTPVVTQVQQSTYDLKPGLINFTVNGELQAATIDTNAKSVTVAVPDTADLHKLNVTVSLAPGISAKLNNTMINGPLVFDLTQQAQLTLSSPKTTQTLSFAVNVQTEMQFFGLLGNVIAQKSLNKKYNFYFDQFDGSLYQSINCGPTVSTMAAKWADSTFSKTPAYARSMIEPNGGWWQTSDVQSYLEINGLNTAVDTLQNLDSLVKANIDKNQLMILCLDMYYVPQNTIVYQHTQKFYQTAGAGWGHFLLIKGYKQMSSGFYLEIYDPYSDNRYYPSFDSTQIMGLDRYYNADDIRVAAGVWWPYIIIAAPGGTKITNSLHQQISSIGGNPRKIPVARGQ